MDVEKIIIELKRKYPGKKVIVTDPENPGEIVCETKPTKDHPEWSEIIAVIDYSRPHYHKKLTEVYEVVKGQLTIYKNNHSYKLKAGGSMVLKPKNSHSAKGKETWVRVYSMPGWNPADHILVFSDKKVSRKQYDQSHNSGTRKVE